MVELGELREEDAGLLFELLDGTGLSEAEFQAAIRERVWLEEDGLLRAYTIREKESGRLAGTIRLVFREEWGEIGIWLGREFQGRGLGGAAIEQVKKVGFGELGLSRIEARILAGNELSQRAFTGRGFHLRERRGRAVMEGGKWQDLLVFEARRSDFDGV